MLHDTIMSLVVVIVIIGLSVVWKFTIPGRPRGDRRVGLAREALRRPGRPRDDQLHPAARLVLLLPLLPAPDLQVAGVGDPRHDRHPDAVRAAAARAAVHRPARRAAAARGGPVAMVAAVLVILSMGDPDLEGRDREGVARLRGRPAGAGVGGGAGLRGQPGRDRGRGDLRAERLRHLPHVPRARARPSSVRPISPRSARTARASQDFADYVANPRRLRQQRRCSPYGEEFGGALDDEQLAQLGEFLRRLQGRRGVTHRARAARRLRRDARLPRYHRRVRGALREAARRGPGRGGVRGRPLRVGRGDRGARDRALRRRAPVARRGARAARRGRARRRHGLRPRTTGARRTRRARRRSTPTSICPCSTGTLGSLASGRART